MRRRPKVELFVPPVAVTGEPLRLALALTARAPTPIDCIELSLDGIEEVSRGEGTPRGERILEHRVLDVRARLAEKGELPAGKTRLSHTLSLPPDAPASYHGARVVVRYQIHVRVAIPWWADVDETFNLRVERPAVARPAPRPIATTTRAGADTTFLEVALDDSAFAPGDVISGAVAIGNLRGRTVKGVDLTLVGAERVTVGGHIDVAEAHRLTLRRAFGNLDSSDEGRELAFSVPVPATAAPSYEWPGSALFWGLEVRADLGWGEHVVHATPITIRAYSGRQRAGRARRTVGSDRWRSVWADIAARHRLDLEPLELALVGSSSGIPLRVWVETDRSGRRLAAALQWPSFEIGLRVDPEHFSLRRVRLQDSRFERRFVAAGNSPDQVRAVLGARLRRALLSFERATMRDDTALVRASVRLSGYDAHHLEPFLTSVEALAAALALAQRRVPAPDDTPERAVAAWRRFADETGGRFVPGSLSIRGATLDGVPFSLVSELPHATVVAVLLPAQPHDGAGRDSELDLSTDSPAVRGIVHELLATEPRPAFETPRSRLRLGDGWLAFDLGAPLHDPAPVVRPVLAALIALGRRLRGERPSGPYR